MSSRYGDDRSRSGGPTRWRSTHGLADPEPEDIPRQSPPVSPWKSTGNLIGAGSLPRPWTRQRTGNNVQRMMERLQSQEDGPRPSWADEVDDGRPSDAPRARLRSGLTGRAEQPRPPRPRSMGEWLGLKQRDEAEDEEGNQERAGVTERQRRDRESPEARRRGLGAFRAVDDYGSRSLGRRSGVSPSRYADRSDRRQAARARGQSVDELDTENQSVDVPTSPRVHGERRYEESPPNAATRVSNRHHRARHAEDADGHEETPRRHRGADHSAPHIQTLPSRARYRIDSDLDEKRPLGRLSAEHASAIREIRKAAKAASGSGDELAEPEPRRSVDALEKRRALRDRNPAAEGSHRSAALRTSGAPTPRAATRVGSARTAPLPDLISEEDSNSAAARRSRYRRPEVKPADDSYKEQADTGERTGKVDVKLVSARLKSGKTEEMPIEDEIGNTRGQKQRDVDGERTSATESPEHMDSLQPRARPTKRHTTDAKENEEPNGAQEDTRAGNVPDDGRVKAVLAEVITSEGEEPKPVEEPKYKPVAAPRRLTASGMTLDQVTIPQPARRSIDLNASFDDYKKSRSRGNGRLANTKEARTKIVPMNERGSGLRARGEVQDFEKLRAECRRSGRLFEDPEFPATDCSIFFSRTPPRPFEWKRPHEICSNPKFILKGASRFDVQQGELGDCWLLAAVANITLNQELFAQIVPSDQEMDDQYAGIFHFRFWQYGRWVDVVVDDRLPTYHGQLAFMHSQDNREFWSALLEKAYAKLHGSYEALKGGTTCEAMEDFSGGVTEMYDIEQAPENLFQIMLKANQRQSLMSCSIEPDPYVAEAEMSNGLIKGHAYSVTKACLADIETPRVQGKIPMVRIRNPWGNEAEWKGAFSDKSPEWNYIPEETRRELGLTFDADGEFWMTFKDFTRNFQRLEICNLSPDSLDDDEDDASRRWEMSVFEGAWVRGATAGGCRNYINTFAHNPQYRIQLHDVDEDDEERKCTVIIAVMQKNRRAQRRLGLDCLTIGFSIYHLNDPDSAPKPLDTQFFRYNCSVARAPSFINLREVSCRFKLPPGSYCIVPSTFEPNEEGEFLIRIFSEKRNNMEENDEEVGPGQVSDEITPELSQESEYDRAVRQFFTQIAGDNLEVDWRELKEVLDYALKKEFEFDGFSKDTVRSMVALLDVDNSGQLGLEEFKSLWSSIRLWKSVFKKHDRSGSSYLSGFQLRAALNESGYRVNNNMLNLLMHRYGDREGRVAFDDFMACAVKMKTCIEIFKDKDPRQTNKATFSLEDWMEHNMYS